MKKLARLLLLGLACAGLSSCLITTTGLTGTVCYDKVCVSVQVPPQSNAAQPAPSLPTTSTPWPAPQQLVVKNSGK